MNWENKNPVYLPPQGNQRGMSHHYRSLRRLLSENAIFVNFALPHEMFVAKDAYSHTTRIWEEMRRRRDDWGGWERRSEEEDKEVMWEEYTRIRWEDNEHRKEKKEAMNAMRKTNEGKKLLLILLNSVASVKQFWLQMMRRQVGHCCTFAPKKEKATLLRYEGERERWEGTMREKREDRHRGKGKRKRGRKKLKVDILTLLAVQYFGKIDRSLLSIVVGLSSWQRKGFRRGCFLFEDFLKQQWAKNHQNNFK